MSLFTITRALVIENNQAYRYLLEHTLAEQGFTTDSGDSMEVGSKGDFEDMFHAGDEGVYAAKDAGRNQVVYVPMD
ncbi:MAG: hypothetical protein ACO3DT_06040 [Gammaproteobacteria bacterium]